MGYTQFFVSSISVQLMFCWLLSDVQLSCWTPLQCCWLSCPGSQVPSYFLICLCESTLMTLNIFWLIVWHINYFHIFDLGVEEAWSFGGVTMLCFLTFLMFLSCDLLICWGICLFQFWSLPSFSLWGFNPRYHSEKRKWTTTTAATPNQIRKHSEKSIKANGHATNNPRKENGKNGVARVSSERQMIKVDNKVYIYNNNKEWNKGRGQEREKGRLNKRK